MKKPSSSLFPGLPSNVLVHSGFADQHAKTATTILTEVKRLISSKGATSVILVCCPSFDSEHFLTESQAGHSLGGALSELGALHMVLNLPSNIHVKAVTYGTPRVGNPAFATYFDSKVCNQLSQMCMILIICDHQVPDFQRINNEKDIIPIVPGRGLGFQHPHGEVHIISPNNAVACSGNDATDSKCTIATVPNIFVGNILDHPGPYQGINIGTIFCT